MADDPVDGPRDGEVAARLRVVIGRLNRLLRQNSVEGLSLALVSALATVEQHGPIRLGDLAVAEKVSPSTLTRIEAALEDRGLVRREPDPRDRRVSWVSLTDEGEQLLERIRGERTLWLSQRVAGLSPEHRAAVVAALDALDELARLGG